MLVSNLKARSANSGPSDYWARDRGRIGAVRPNFWPGPGPRWPAGSGPRSGRWQQRIAPNLLERDFNAPAPNQVLAGDITYISTSDGWLYLAVLLDLYSRRVVGWALSDCIDTELALSALRMAASTRCLAPGWIHHTDRDCRYGSDDYLAALERLGARPSMSRKGDCWDNAVSESFFATLEKELLALQPLQSRSNTREQVANYIESYYNLVRLHSHLDYVSPIEFETNAPS
jgi:putative transposase